jgi:hypothetical protein
MRAKFLAAIVSAVAPHSPTLAGSSSDRGAVTLHGPIAQFLQHMPSAPMGQGFMAAARSKTVEMPSLRARSISFCEALHAVHDSLSVFFVVIDISRQRQNTYRRF